MAFGCYLLFSRVIALVTYLPFQSQFHDYENLSIRIPVYKMKFDCYYFNKLIFFIVNRRRQEKCEIIIKRNLRFYQYVKKLRKQIWLSWPNETTKLQSLRTGALNLRFRPCVLWSDASLLLFSFLLKRCKRYEKEVELFNMRTNWSCHGKQETKGTKDRQQYLKHHIENWMTEQHKLHQQPVSWTCFYFVFIWGVFSYICIFFVCLLS